MASSQNEGKATIGGHKNIDPIGENEAREVAMRRSREQSPLNPWRKERL